MRVKHNHLSRRKSKFLISLLFTAALFLGFHANLWNVAESTWFEEFQQDTQSLVVGRLVQSRDEGVFSFGGLTGVGVPHDINDKWMTPQQWNHQYAVYLEGRTFERYSPYLSQPGGQGLIFSLADRVIPLSAESKLISFSMLTSLLSALALTLVVLWFFDEFGCWIALVVAASMLLSQWLTVFGRNLWWSLWAFYVPMLAVMYFLKRQGVSGKRQLGAFGTVVFVSVFTKCFVNGYEYMTTTLLMMMTPFVYYAVRDKWCLRATLKWAASAALFSFAATLLSLGILCVQIAAVRGDLIEGVAHIAFAFGKRTRGSPASFPPRYKPGLEATTMSVVRIYLDGTFFQAHHGSAPSDTRGDRSSFEIRYSQIILAFFVMSAVLLFLNRGERALRRRWGHVALIAAAWFSLLAPLSWYVIFKAHSYVHTHMNHILWQMPFTFFGFAVCGLAIQKAVSGWIGRFARARRSARESARYGAEPIGDRARGQQSAGHWM